MSVNDDSISRLLTTIERVRRRKISDSGSADIVSYIDPNNYVQKLAIANNHVIQGRRGSGKTTLMLKRLGLDLNEIQVNIDCQPIKGRTANGITLYIVEKILAGLGSSFKEVDLSRIRRNSSRLHWLFGIFNNREREAYTKARRQRSLLDSVTRSKEAMANLDKQRDEVAISRKTRSERIEERSIIDKRESSAEGKFGIEAKGKYSAFSFDGNAKIQGMLSSSKRYAQSEKAEIVEGSEEVFTIAKKQLLQESKEAIAEILNSFTKSEGKKIVLLLDDYYLIPESEQIEVVHFLHDIYKLAQESCFCFKLSVLPYRIKLNPDGKYDLSLKDDFSPIRLDHDLADFENLKNHLLAILANLDQSIGLATSDIRNCYVNDEVINYSIIASGGIPRDFIVLFADLVVNARSSGRDTISKSNIYNVVNELKNDKEQNIEFDSDISPEMIRDCIAEITRKIVEGHRTNVFLYQKERTAEHENMLRNLINLRYIHPIKEGISSETVKKKLFDAYLVDMILYATGQRMPKDFNFREFWLRDEAQRQPELHRAPILQFDERR